MLFYLLSCLGTAVCVYVVCVCVCVANVFTRAGPQWLGTRPGPEARTVCVCVCVCVCARAKDAVRVRCRGNRKATKGERRARVWGGGGRAGRVRRACEGASACLRARA